MEQQLSKPESKNMDACLRRLKQELVCTVLSTSISYYHCRMLLFLNSVHFEHVAFALRSFGTLKDAQTKNITHLHIRNIQNNNKCGASFACVLPDFYIPDFYLVYNLNWGCICIPLNRINLCRLKALGTPEACVHIPPLSVHAAGTDVLSLMSSRQLSLLAGLSLVCGGMQVQKRKRYKIQCVF